MIIHNPPHPGEVIREFCMKPLPACAHPEIVDFGSGQGRSEFETAGVARLRRGLQIRENAGLDQKMLFPDGHKLTEQKYTRV